MREAASLDSVVGRAPKAVGWPVLLPPMPRPPTSSRSELKPATSTPVGENILSVGYQTRSTAPDLTKEMPP